MPDDRPRRAPTATERVLAEAKQRRTSPHGVPVEIDPELTPAPADPATLTTSAMSRMDTDEKIRAVVAGLSATATAVAHEQQERRRGEDLARELGGLSTKVAAHAAVLSEMVGVAQAVDSLAAFTAKIADKLERLLVASEVQEQRDEDLAKQMDRLFALVGGLQTRIGQLESGMALVAQRVEALEVNVADRLQRLEQRVGAVESKASRLDTHRKISTALTRREQAKAGGLGAVIGAIASAVAWIASHWIG